MREPTSLSFAGEACESFANLLRQIEGYCVRLTPLDGSEPFDAFIVGPGDSVVIDGDCWYDAVSFRRDEHETGIEDATAPVETIRVRDVYIY